MSITTTSTGARLRARRAGVACAILALALHACCAGAARAQQSAIDGGWQQRYERARAALLGEDFASAAAEFEALEASAPSPGERRLASELGGIARGRLERWSVGNLFAPRTTDELAMLYTGAVFYGLGASSWLTLQLRPTTIGGALLPFAIITPATIGLVALADGYRPFARGVPHAITAGMYLGFGEALWLVGYQHAYATHHDGVDPWHAERVSTALWIGSTVGAGIGGLVGALGRPTPGQLSWTASAGIWAGMLSAFAASALEPEGRQRAQASYLAGGIGYNAGLVAGILLAPSVAPSVARARFIDLGGLGGALLGAGAQALIGQEFGSRANMGATALGGALGLGLAWWATSDMPGDRDLRKAGSHAIAPTGLRGLRPTLAPIRGGFSAGVSGQL